MVYAVQVQIIEKGNGTRARRMRRNGEKKASTKKATAPTTSQRANERDTTMDGGQESAKLHQYKTSAVVIAIAYIVV